MEEAARRLRGIVEAVMHGMQYELRPNQQI
jgi:hypothetical protein